jgi:hypothetical protein
MPDMPRDLLGLISYLREQKEFRRIANNLLMQWGPQNRPLLGPEFLPPRFLDENEGTISEVRIRSVAAKDKSRYSPAPKVGRPQMFGSIRYRLGDSALLYEITGSDYDGLVKWLDRNLSMEAAARLLGLFRDGLIKSLVEHDELKIWEAVQTNAVTRRGDNGYFQYENGPDLSAHFVDVSAEPWLEADVDPWEHIFNAVNTLVDLGFDKGGIRIVYTNKVANALRRNPHTATRAGKSVIVTNGSGQITASRLTTTVSNADLTGLFEGEGLQAPREYDRRIGTETGEVRAYAEGHMSFIASTGMNEEVRFNQDNPADVRVVNDVLGFLGVGKPPGQPTPMRETFVRAFTEQTDKRIETEGAQTTGPVILTPQARVELSGILEEA